MNAQRIFMMLLIKFKAIIIFAAIVLSTNLAYGYANPHQQSYRVNRGETVPVDEPDLCQQVTKRKTINYAIYKRPRDQPYV